MDDQRAGAVRGRKGITAVAIGGVAAGPLFLTSSIIQGLARDGFDLTHQPISFLSLGPLGWLERMTFVFAGALVVAFSFSIQQVQRERGSRLESLFLSLTGAGLIVAGLVPPDAGFGYPAGVPDGPPSVITFHSQLHGLGFTLSFVGFVLACVVNVRYAVRRRAWRYVAYTIVSAAGAMTFALTPGNSGIALRDLVAAALLWAWVSQRAIRLNRAERAARSSRLEQDPFAAGVRAL